MDREVKCIYQIWYILQTQKGGETPESVRRSSAQSREKYRLSDGEMNDFQKFMLEKLLNKFNLMGKFGYLSADHPFHRLE